jgi:hypothetical protein
MYNDVKYNFLFIHIMSKFILYFYQLLLVKRIIGYLCKFLKVLKEIYLTNSW